MPVLTPSSLPSIAQSLFEHLSQDKPFYKITPVFAAIFGSQDDYAGKSSYKGLCGHSLSLASIAEKRYQPSLAEIMEKLQVELDERTAKGQDVVIVVSHNMWAAVSEDPDGFLFSQKAKAAGTESREAFDSFDSPSGALQMALAASVDTAAISNTVTWDPREDSNDLDPDEMGF